MVPNHARYQAALLPALFLLRFFYTTPLDYPGQAEKTTLIAKKARSVPLRGPEEVMGNPLRGPEEVMGNPLRGPEEVMGNPLRGPEE